MTYECPNIMDVILEKTFSDMLMTPFFMNKFRKRVKLRGDENILEFGCGAGNFSRRLVKLIENGKLNCVDISEFWIEKAKNRLKGRDNVRFLLGDIRDVIPKEERFDLIFIHLVLHDIPKSERQGIVNILAERLEENGRIYIGEPINESHGMPVEEIRDMMGKSGLKEDDHYYNKIFPSWRSFNGIYSKA